MPDRRSDLRPRRARPGARSGVDLASVSRRGGPRARLPVHGQRRARPAAASKRKRSRAAATGPAGRGVHRDVTGPRRIVCLTEETTETLYLLGEQDRIVGISGFTVRPPQARREKPKVSALTSANIDKILAPKPDLVLTFSDLQADIVADLIRRGLDVHAFNQRTIAGIPRYDSD